MNTIAELATSLTTARCCDAFTPCATCRSERTQYAALRHAERVANLTVAPTVPQPRTALGRRHCTRCGEGFCHHCGPDIYEQPCPEVLAQPTLEESQP